MVLINKGMTDKKMTVDYSDDKEILDAVYGNNHKKFCVLPFIHLATTTEGHCRLCCKVSKHDVILDDNGEPFNLNKHTIDEIWSSKHMRDRRLRILNEEQLPECKTCWEEEEIFYSKRSDENHNGKTDLPSKRRKENQKWCQREKTKLQDSWHEIVENPRIRYFDIRLSNLCNLKCRMCWPHFSSQISKEQVQFHSEGLPTWYKNYDVPEWDTEMLWEGINSNLIDLEEISFVGGEPTMHDDMYKLLDQLVESGQSKNMRLKLTTNLTNIQERFYYYADNFKNTIINGSIDGIGKTNDYIRYPSHWEIIESNIKRLLRDRRERFLSLTLTPVIQIYNIFNLYEMIKWYTDIWLNLDYYKTKEYFTITLDLLYDPDYLSVKNLNPDAKRIWYETVLCDTVDHLDQIINNIENYDEESQNYWYVLHDLRKRVLNIALYMNVVSYNQQTDLWGEPDFWTDTTDPELTKKLHDYTRQLDKHRGQDITNIIPDFYEMTKNEKT